MSDTITVFKGDGIGPEITDAVLKILDAAGAGLTYEIFSVGEAEYEAHGELIPAEGFASFDKNKVPLRRGGGDGGSGHGPLHQDHHQEMQ